MESGTEEGAKVALNVKIKTLSGCNYELVVNPSTSVLQFKELISQRTQIPVDNQKLIYLGRVLKDCQTVGSYDIKEGCAVHLVGNKCTGVASTTNNTNDQGPTPMSPASSSTLSADTPMTDAPMLPPLSLLTSGIQPSQPCIQPNPFQQQAPSSQRMSMNPLSFLRMMGRGCTSQSSQPSSCSRQVSLCSQKGTEDKQAKYQCPSTRTRCTQQPAQTGPSPSLPCPNTPASVVDTDLDQAISQRSINRVKELVESGANINRGGLHKACMFGHLDIVQYMIAKGAKLDLKLANGETCVHTCAFYGQKEILEYLLSQCEPNIYERTSDGKTALMLAVYNNHKSVVELLLGHGASVHDNDVNGATPLILAAQKGNKEIVELLLQHNARVDARDCRGRTALHFSASGGFPNIMSVLLQYGAPINAMNSNRETALHYSTFHGKKDCVLFLLSRGADVNILSNSGTALQLAICKGHSDIVELLQQHGAN